MGYGPMGLNDYIDEVTEINVTKGWREDITSPRPNSPGDLLMLTVSELAEALEEVRDHRGLNETYTVIDKDGLEKPEGVPIELADAIIRICDMAGRWNINLEQAMRTKLEYNRLRPYKHGGRSI